MSSQVVKPEDVLEMLMGDGTIDAIRLKIINQLKANEELKSNTITMVEQSKVLNTPGAEKQTKRELFDALRRELESPVLEKASRAVWDLILDDNSLGKEISDTVERVFCRLSGFELPPRILQAASQPTTSGEQQLDNGKECKDKDVDEVKAKEMLVTPPKKRNYSEISVPVPEVAVNETCDRPSGSTDEGTS